MIKRLTCPAKKADSTVDFTGMTSHEVILHIAVRLGLAYNEIGDKCFLDLPRPKVPKVDIKPGRGKLVLPATWFYQYDSRFDQGGRMCNSSSHAVVVKFLRPGYLPDHHNADDAYFETVRLIGDTTKAWVQMKALQHYGIKAEHRTDLDWPDVYKQIQKGYPVPLGICHKGPLNNINTVDGHVICAVGNDGDDIIVHDPAGNLDLVGGGYNTSASGKFLRNSKKNLTPRWRVNGTGGWGTIVKGLIA